MTVKHSLTYALVLVVFGAGIVLTLHWGQRLDHRSAVADKAEGESNALASEASSQREPLSILLLQIIVIIIVAKAVGGLFRKIGQPAVIGEMVAGILLGPSLLGLVYPDGFSFLFPPSSLPPLSLLSQVGVILFMFVVGIDLNVDHLRQKVPVVVLVSHVSIVLPFFLGTVLSLFLFDSLLAAEATNVSFRSFALFMGVSMSVTAFPVLARIIEERGLTDSQLGHTAIACAAVDDVTAWCLLAVVVAFVKAKGGADAVLMFVLALVFISLMLFVVKPILGRLLKGGVVDGVPGRGLMAGVLAFIFIAALATETIGIHALFGAFLAGVAMPPDPELRQALKRGLESFSTVFLLPLFFAFTGLRTEIGLLNDWASWLVCAGVIALAIAGKLGGSTLAARWTGMSWRNSLSLGVLMNTRGLVELIVLNTGLDLRILSPRVFTMMVLMALATTFMTGPLLSLLGERDDEAKL